MADAATRCLRPLYSTIGMHIDRIKEDPEMAVGNCNGIV